MTSIGFRREHQQPLALPARRASILRQVLLSAGVLSSLLYIGVDLVAAARYPGYNIANQAVSELAAIGAPTARLWAAMGIGYEILVIAFAIGVLQEARGNRALRITGVLLVLFAASGFLWAFFPMHPRGTELTWQDAGHVVLSTAVVLLILCYIGAGAFVFGRRFRIYSFATIAALLIAFAVVFTWIGRVAAGEVTPWLGLIERINVYGYLLWVAVFAIALMRRRQSRAVR